MELFSSTEIVPSKCVGFLFSGLFKLIEISLLEKTHAYDDFLMQFCECQAMKITSTSCRWRQKFSKTERSNPGYVKPEGFCIGRYQLSKLSAFDEGLWHSNIYKHETTG